MDMTRYIKGTDSKVHAFIKGIGYPFAGLDPMLKIEVILAVDVI